MILGGLLKFPELDVDQEAAVRGSHRDDPADETFAPPAAQDIRTQKRPQGSEQEPVQAELLARVVQDPRVVLAVEILLVHRLGHAKRREVDQVVGEITSRAAHLKFLVEVAAGKPPSPVAKEPELMVRIETHRSDPPPELVRATGDPVAVRTLGAWFGDREEYLRERGRDAFVGVEHKYPLRCRRFNSAVLVDVQHQAIVRSKDAVGVLPRDRACSIPAA